MPGRPAVTTVAVACASPLLQRGILDLVREVAGMELVGSARDPLGVLQLLRTTRPRVLVLCHALAPQLRDVMRADDHRPRLLLLSSRQHLGPRPVCGRQCACGFVRDQAPTEHVLTMLRILASCDAPRTGLEICARCPAQSSLQLPTLPLSAREYEVFVRIGDGEGTSSIAGALGVSVKTIETHRENIKRKLGLDSAHALLTAAVQWRDGEFMPGPD